MTGDCFWIGIINGLVKIGKLVKITPDQFLKILKTFNSRNTKVLWNNEKLNRKQMDENVQRIKEINQTSNGYDCSSCDPVLLLICQMYKVNINHYFDGTKIQYKPIKETYAVINCESNKSHFWLLIG